MRCIGDFNNDRMCNLCKIMHRKQYKKCKTNHEKLEESIHAEELEILHQIEETCPHKESSICKLSWQICTPDLGCRFKFKLKK